MGHIFPRNYKKFKMQGNRSRAHSARFTLDRLPHFDIILLAGKAVRKLSCFFSARADEKRSAEKKIQQRRKGRGRGEVSFDGCHAPGAQAETRKPHRVNVVLLVLFGRGPARCPPAWGRARQRTAFAGRGGASRRIPIQGRRARMA